MARPERDPLTGQYTTGHSWDGIKELKTPIPGWWLSVWFASIAFALGYLFLFPSFPSLTGYTGGAPDRTAREALIVAQKDAGAAQAALRARINALPVSEISRDPELARFAFNGGKAAFAVHCIGCHGAGAGGQAGQFPALVDDDWLWGGSLTEIHQTIAHGIRNEDPDSRQSQMPAFADVLSDAEIRQVSAYVATLSNAAVTPERRASMPGAAIFAANCAACHGEQGEGGRPVGAPRLSDAIWLYGRSETAIAAQIRHPRMGMMPAWEPRIGPETVKMLAIYIHGLGGGEPEPAAEAAVPAPAAPAPDAPAS